MWHGDRIDAYRVMVAGPDGKTPLGKPLSGREDVTKWVFKKWDEKAWIGLIGLRIATVGRRL